MINSDDAEKIIAALVKKSIKLHTIINEVITDLTMSAALLLSEGEPERAYRLRDIENKLRSALEEN
jgi:hypothetical protein